jgi:ABC-type transport system involved in multi-copper enzyme maturation permease subunit
VVAGAAGAAAGLVAAGLAIPLGGWILAANGVATQPVPWLTGLRVVAGTAGLVAVTAVLAVAVGALVRRGAAAVTAVVALVLLPYVLGVAGALPAGVAQWLLRTTPAAGFAIQQTLQQYPQVDGPYTPSNGYLPLAPWAGFAVLCGYAALALGLAVLRIRRGDT